MSELDKRTSDKLEPTLRSAGWSPGDETHTSYGVTMNFRKCPATSTYLGMESRDIHGKDRDDAIRKFLAELESEETASGPRL